MKSNILISLAAAAMLLTLANILVDTVFKKKSNLFDKESSADLIENVYLESIDEFGIDLKHISIRPNKDKSKDSVKNLINVTAPSDVPYPAFIQYMEEKFEQSSVRIIAYEKKNKEIEIKFFSNNILKLVSVVARDEHSTRNGFRFSFLLYDFKALSKSGQHDLLTSPFPCAIELIPSEKETAMPDSLAKFNKGYVVLLNDDIAGKKFILGSDYSNERLKASLANILSTYKFHTLYLLDTDAGLTKQPNYSIVDKELKRNKITVRKLNFFTVLDKNGKEDLEEKITSLSGNSSASGKIILISAKNYLNNLKAMSRLFIKGCRIVPIAENL